MSAIESTAEIAAPFEVRLGNEQTEFSGSVRMMREVAESFGVSVTAQELKDWQTLGRASYVIDQYFDVVKADPTADIAVEHFSQLSIPGIPPQLIHDCIDWLERQAPDRQVTLVEYIAFVRKMVEAQAAATTVPEVVEVRHQEADVLGDILSLNSEGTADAAARQKFNNWIPRAMRAGYILDSLLDIKEDYESGTSGVEPGLKASAKMAAYLLKDTVEVARVSPRALSKGAMVMVRYQFKKMHPDFYKPTEII
jgi:hypothetical protein